MPDLVGSNQEIGLGYLRIYQQKILDEPEDGFLHIRRIGPCLPGEQHVAQQDMGRADQLRGKLVSLEIYQTGTAKISTDIRDPDHEYHDFEYAIRI